MSYNEPQFRIGAFMRRLGAAILVAGLMLLPAIAADEPPVPIARPQTKMRSSENDVETPPTPIPRPLLPSQKITFTGGVGVQFDIAYSAPAGNRPLTLDLYTPGPSPLPLPIVLYIHDGEWNGGDSRHALAFSDFPQALAGLAAEGYVVASINYRLSHEAHFPAALQDVKAAIRWLRGRAPEYGGDPTRLAVWGMAAGGQLAAMAGTTCGVTHFEPDSDAGLDAPSDCAEAVIDWFGPTDMESPGGNKAETDKDGFVAASPASEAGLYLGCEPQACPPGVARLASPQTFITETSPPFLIQHGDADTTVAPEQSQKLYDALRQKGVPAEIVLYPGVGHGFWKDGKPDAVTVTKAMDKLSEFLATTFPNAPAKPEPRSTEKK
jgi:acetyl esterase/lipase